MVNGRHISLPAAMVDDLKLALVQQAPLLLLTALLMDGGDLIRWCSAALFGYWLGVLAIAKKRSRYGLRSDRWFVKWGSITLVFLGWAMEPAIHHYFR